MGERPGGAQRYVVAYVLIHSLATVNAVVEDTCMRRFTPANASANELHTPWQPCGLAGRR
jgi:hypothetical protein